jgi:hypothetical protein
MDEDRRNEPPRRHAEEKVNRRLTQMDAEAEKLTRRHRDTEVQKKISHEEAEAQEGGEVRPCTASAASHRQCGLAPFRPFCPSRPL